MTILGTPLKHKMELRVLNRDHCKVLCEEIKENLKTSESVTRSAEEKQELDGEGPPYVPEFRVWV